MGEDRMKLYYSPFACSLATHIALREAGLDVSLERIDLATKLVADGTDLREVNPMGQVPTLVTDDGLVLTENGTVLTWVGDRVPERALVPPPASNERYELTRWLSFVATEIHKKGLALVFDAKAPEEVKTYARSALALPLARLEQLLSERDYLIGAQYTVADAYLFWALTIAPHGGVPLDAYPKLGAYRERILERPAVREAVKFELKCRTAAEATVRNPTP
jgi:glutathione S-transferase